MDEKKLKYLDFVQLVAIYVTVLFSSIYKYAQGNSGPLKPGIQTVENAVKAVIGPVYHKFHNVPFQLLVFVDHKVWSERKPVNNLLGITLCLSSIHDCIIVRYYNRPVYKRVKLD